MKRTVFWLFLALITLGGLFVQKTRAANDFVINRFDSQINILETGVVRVQEALAVDYGSIPHHGIYRFIPYIYQGSNQPRVFTDIQFRAISRNSIPEEYTISFENGYEIVKIGSPNLEITGIQNYLIEYEVRGILKSFSGYDELYWNVTGNQAEVKTLSASAKVILPTSGVIQYSCYEGPKEATTTCQKQKLDDQTVQFAANQSLEPGEGLTVSVGYKSGLVPILTVNEPFGGSDADIFLGMGLLFFSLLIGLCILVWQWYKHGRDEDGKHRPLPFLYKQAVAPEYESPEGIPPALLGLIEQESVGPRAVSSTIVHLASRGYLTIKEIEPTIKLFGQKDFLLTRTEKSEQDLLNYEQILLKAVFGNEQIKKLSDLKNKFYKDLPAIYQAIQSESKERGYFMADPGKTIKKYVLIGLGILLGSFLIGFLAAFFTQVYFPVIGSVGLGLVGIITMLSSKAMIAKSGKGTELFWKIKGYRMFLTFVEKYRQLFLEKEGLISEVMPYAMVFGITKKLAQKLEQMNLPEQSLSWYTGINAFNMVSFANQMNTLNTVITTSVATSPSGSGSGGGGFSGGGFGGGGTGGW